MIQCILYGLGIASLWYLIYSFRDMSFIKDTRALGRWSIVIVPMSIVLAFALCNLFGVFHVK